MQTIFIEGTEARQKKDDIENYMLPRSVLLQGR